MSVFSERVTALMLKIGVTQKQLAEKIGVTESAMSYYVSGTRTPRSDVLLRVANALGTSTDYLLGNDDADKRSGDDELLYIQRNLGKLNPEQLKKAEKLLKTVFDDIFEDEEE